MEQPISAMRRISGASQCHGANGVTSGERIATAPGTRWSRGSARHGIAVVAVVCAVRLSGLVNGFRSLASLDRDGCRVVLGT